MLWLIQALGRSNRGNYMESYNDYLMHYGRLGQKWGVMNGPPYPIGQTKVQRLREKNKKLREKKKEAELKSKQAELKKAIKDEKKRAELLNKQSKKEDGEISEKNSRLNAKGKGLFRMSDKEISDLKKRTDNEKEIRNNEISSIANGSTFVKALLLAAGTTVITTAVNKIAENTGQQYAKNYIANSAARKTASIQKKAKRKANRQAAINRFKQWWNS